MPIVPTSIDLDNLRAIIETASLYPSLTIQMVLDRLGLPSSAAPDDLLDLQGPDACEALEAELVILSLREAA